MRLLIVTALSLSFIGCSSPEPLPLPVYTPKPYVSSYETEAIETSTASIRQRGYVSHNNTINTNSVDTAPVTSPLHWQAVTMADGSMSFILADIMQRQFMQEALERAPTGAVMQLQIASGLMVITINSDTYSVAATNQWCRDAIITSRRPQHPDADQRGIFCRTNQNGWALVR